MGKLSHKKRASGSAASAGGVPRQRGQWFVGREVLKYFIVEEGGTRQTVLFGGRVESVNFDDPTRHPKVFGPPPLLFRVTYTDGDSEDLYLRDLLPVLVPEPSGS